jgi:hypothetical protein
MKKYLLLFSALLITGTAVAEDTSTKAAENAPCTITCYEKSSSCYVTADGTGCLDITDKKPVCTKNSCVCNLSHCDTKTTYKSDGEIINKSTN